MADRWLTQIGLRRLNGRGFRTTEEFAYENTIDLIELQERVDTLLRDPLIERISRIVLTRVRVNDVQANRRSLAVRSDSQ